MGRIAQMKQLLLRITSDKTTDYARVYLEIHEEKRNKKSNAVGEILEDDEVGFPCYLIYCSK